MGALSRTRLLYVAALVGGLAALGAGWIALGGDAPPSPRDRYVEGVVGVPGRVNPLFAGRNPVDADLAALIFNGLTRLGADGTPLPDLAERWEITPDGRTYTFHLRNGVFWHDGEPFDAHDVAFTLALLQADDFTGPPQLAARWAQVESLVVDARTILLRLPEPSASFLVQAALGIVPEHALEALDGAALAEATFNRDPVGTGPYRLVDLNRASAVLQRNPSHHLGPPQLDELEIRFYPYPAALAIALEDGDVDGALLTTTLADGEWRLLALTEAGYLVLYINNQRPPLDEPELRRALDAAIDPLDAPQVAASGLPGEGPFVPGSWAYRPGVRRAPGRAGDYFDAARWRLDADGRRARDGVPLRLELATSDDPLRVALAERTADQLRAQGVTVSVVGLPAERLFRERLAPRDFDLLLFAWVQGADPDPYSAWHTSQIGADGRNIAGFTDSEADRLLEEARLTVDVAERLALYARFGERFDELAPGVVLHYPQRLYALPPALGGVSEGLLFGPESRFRDVHEWRFED